MCADPKHEFTDSPPAVIRANNLCGPIVRTVLRKEASVARANLLLDA